MDRQPGVDTLASRRHGVIYINIMSDLMARLHQHRSGVVDGFTSQ
jgi:putative endonuclease